GAPGRRLADFQAECRWGLGRIGRKLRVQWPRPSTRTKHGLSDGVGAAGAYGGRRAAQSRCCTRHRLPVAQPGIRRLLERAAIHRDGLPASFLPPLPWLPKVFPRLGACSLPQSDPVPRSPLAFRNVSIGPSAPYPVVAVTGLVMEARIASGPGVRAIAG